MRILIVDDHRPSVEVLRHVLISRGHECACADDVPGALESLQLFRPDAVIYEWNLRAGAGRGLAHRLRAASTEFGAVPLIITISTLDEPTEFIRDEAVDAYMVKPFDLESLTCMLR